MELTVSDNKEKNRFEAFVENDVAFVEYKISGNTLKLIHTEVPKKLEGKGIASQMVKKVLQEIKDENKKIVPICPFIKNFIKKHPHWESIVKD